MQIKKAFANYVDKLRIRKKEEIKTIILDFYKKEHTHINDFTVAEKTTFNAQLHRFVNR